MLRAPNTICPPKNPIEQTASMGCLEEDRLSVQEAVRALEADLRSQVSRSTEHGCYFNLISIQSTAVLDSRKTMEYPMNEDENQMESIWSLLSR